MSATVARRNLRPGQIRTRNPIVERWLFLYTPLIFGVCFLVGPFPGFVELVGSKVDGIVFFVGSIFFTSAATLQLVSTGVLLPRRLDWWACAVQLVGTVFFNVSTFHALQTGLDATEYDRVAV